METNWCFHLFVAFIILVGDLPVKVAEDFAAIGERRGVHGLKRAEYYRVESPSIGDVPLFFQQNSPNTFAVSGLTREAHLTTPSQPPWWTQKDL